jgi:hypothetical protein
VYFTVTDPDNPHDVIYDGENPESALRPGYYPATVMDDGAERSGRAVVMETRTFFAEGTWNSGIFHRKD